MTTMSYLGAIGAAQREAMDADERVVIIGEDVEANVYGTTGGSGKSRSDKGDFLEMYGKNRIRNTTILSPGTFMNMGYGRSEWWAPVLRP